MKAWDDIMRAIWRTRPCAICKEYGYCKHREPEFERAEIEAQVSRVPGDADWDRQFQALGQGRTQ